MELGYLYFAVLLQTAQNTEQANETVMNIVKAGSDVIIKCHSCNVDYLTVTYKAPNGGYEIIKARGETLSRNRIHDRINLLYDLVIDECAYHLLLAEVQFDAAGVFSCWEGSHKTKTTNLVVLSSDNNCFAIPESSDYENIFLRQNDSITILCPFQCAADESCIVTPIWADLTGYRNLTIPGDDFEVNMDAKHAWISFRRGADIKNGTRFDLSFVFDCSSFSNYNQVQLEIHYFGEVPFTLILENNTRSINEDENNKRVAFFIALLAGTGTALAAITAVLLLLRIKTFCYAKSQKQFVGNKKKVAKTDESEMSSYSEIKENIFSEEIRRFDALNDNLYEVINEGTKACENYIIIGSAKSLL